MKKLYSALIVGFIFTYGSLSVFSCTCVLGGLSKRFKKAEAVFVGGIYEYDKADIPKIQNFKEGLPVFLVNKSWKGVNQEFIAVDIAELPKSVGNCNILYHFDENKEYLVFAYGKELKIEPVCSDTRALSGKYDDTVEEISKLNNFWFRFWAKTNPF